MKQFVRKVMSDYQTSLLLRNILFGLFTIALIILSVKIGFSIKKITLYDQAMAYYQEKNWVAAEEVFAQANAITTIRYGDEIWNESMSALTDTRTQLEVLSEQIQTGKTYTNPELMVDVYDSYHFLKKGSLQADEITSAFFTDISNRLKMEAELKAYFLTGKEQINASLQANLAQKTYKDEEQLILFFAAVPAEYFGDEKKKEQEFVTVFRSYDQKKFKDIASTQSFEDVLSTTAKRINFYNDQDLEADWLPTLLEKYARTEINLAIQKNDLDLFSAKATAYRNIKNALPSDSQVLELIDQHIDSQLRQAKRYEESNQFEKALALYEGLRSVTDTSELIVSLQESWTFHEPLRLLQEKYPDKTFQLVMSDEKKWDSEIFVAAFSKDDQLIHFAAKMPDKSVVYLEDDSFSNRVIKNFTTIEFPLKRKSPIILVETDSESRLSTYYGFVPDLSESKWVKRFEIEGDSFAIEGLNNVVVDNPKGTGENERAYFNLKDTGLEYDENNSIPLIKDEESLENPADPLDNSEIPGTEPSTPSKDATETTGEHASDAGMMNVYAGPGETFEVIGQLAKNTSIKKIAEKDGWYQISFDGKDGWIRDTGGSVEQ
ncbi:SH3 domain-containing protein [Brevibacillus daliensis]|uniref:SH3 domain-containing protein n=1 Tax=Brevibacillus daliensis TaxID=2892995 RepID=UPI001E593EF5|nr:SH3 domain-containing protein [Brevibacillus daliensis]